MRHIHNKCYRGAYSRARPTCVERDQAEAPGFDAPWLTANFLKTKHRFYKQVQEELIVACDYLLYTLFISFRLFLTYIISQSYFSLSKVACFRRLHNTARVITVCASLFIHSKAACLGDKIIFGMRHCALLVCCSSWPVKPLDHLSVCSAT